MPIIPIIIIVISVIIFIVAMVQQRNSKKQFNSFINTYTMPYELGNKIAANRMNQNLDR